MNVRSDGGEVPAADSRGGVRIHSYGLTDVGLQRERNEDQFLIADLAKSLLIHQTSLSKEEHARLFGGTQGRLFVVADGMGGQGGGAVASSVAVDTVVHYVLNVMPWFFRLDETREEHLQDELKLALERCEGTIRAAAQESGHPKMGTTLTMGYVLWPHLYVVHVGDSRCYLYRGGALGQITRDHTVAQQMVEGNMMDRERAPQSPWSSILWNAVGGGSEKATPEIYRADLRAEDVVLFCSDGLTRHVGDQDIQDRLGSSGSVESTAKGLVDLAKERGGADNITVVLARFSR